MLVIFSLSALASQVEAKPSLFLSFHEFKSLSAQDRVTYIESLRQMALQSERAGSPVHALMTPADFWGQVFLAQAQAARGDSCIYAGYLSQRDANNSCQRPAAASGSCGAGQTQCNPLLYGYGPSSGGICTSERSYPTRDCEKKYQAFPNYKAYDVANELVKRNMQGEFDAQAAKLQQYCSGATSGEQRNLCKTLLAKSAFMKAKIVASEQRKRDSERRPAQTQDRPAITTTQTPATPAPAVAAPAPRAETPAPAVPARQSDVASPSAEPVTPAPSRPAPAVASSAPAAPAPAAPRPTQASDTPPAAPAPARSADGCIRNITDYKAVESKLPEPFRKMLDQRSAGVFMSGTKSIPMIISLQMVMNLRFVEVGGVKKLKLQSAISSNAPSLASNSDSDSYVDKICLQGDAMQVYIPGAPMTTVKMSGRQVNISTDKGGMEVDIVDRPSYTNQLASVRTQIRGGSR